MNDAGDVVGWYSYRNEKGLRCQTDGFSCRGIHTERCGTAGFLYPGGKSIPIYSPDPNHACLVLNAINIHREMAGSICSGASRAVVVSGTTVTDLNTTLPAGSSWVLSSASDLNDAGFIVGTGTYNGTAHGFMLIPN